ENDIAQDYLNGLNKFRKKNEALMSEYNEARKSNDTQFLKSFRIKRQEIKEQNDEFNMQFIKENKNSLFGLLIMENLIRAKAIDTKEVENNYNSLTGDLQKSKVGLRIKEKIEIALATEVGAIAPDFTAPNPDGKEITLSKIKGNVTIIDFWAAWCGPCRRENPNLVKVYKKYHEKGLEIIGVSLDGSNRQKDAKNDWLNAIEKDGLTWHQVSNLNYFNGPVAKKYNIQAIPAMFVLDNNGKIIAKNLRGAALEQKISELLD
ncbi:MAG: TlpA family protein disulfide reductase, partial [Flavobacteriaceae bacterium]|nr:TlpA family protein disulfide reductase [Flavobacteriaceae bacterium]